MSTLETNTFVTGRIMNISGVTWTNDTMKAVTTPKPKKKSEFESILKEEIKKLKEEENGRTVSKV